MTTDARQKFEHSEKTASCPTCGSDKREVKFTSHFSGMPILECSDPWHGCDSAKESAHDFKPKENAPDICDTCGKNFYGESAEPEEWISVDRRLPEIHQKVLIWMEWKGSRENTGVRFGERTYDGHFRPEGGNGNFDDEVTHWRPLPKPPEHAQKGK